MNWFTDYCEGEKFKAFAAGEFVLDFPAPPGHVNLVGCNHALIPLGSTITVKYKIKGSANFKALDPAPGLAPNFRVMLFNGDWSDMSGRWWPIGTNCAFLVADGGLGHTYTVKVTPWLWSNVQGKQNDAVFKAFLKKMNRLYLAFSGGISFSHGVTGYGARLKVFSVTT